MIINKKIVNKTDIILKGYNISNGSSGVVDITRDINFIT